ncbi:DUF4307 domain-containing protein [Humibacter ginsenosidimutans]|uniref:DUF4307 domain-containing protein n=1 Tax=Humibacter ginsenosidimutans TaxID=2599293 RepID=UPI00143D8AA8|nr:DUF4307 domain-containing protein [Humibacter ginsenosidimutans]
MPEPTVSTAGQGDDPVGHDEAGSGGASRGRYQPAGARYGRTAATKRRDRWLLIALGAFIVVVMVCWTLWAGLDQVRGSSINVDTGANSVIDSQHVKVSFTVSADAGASVACAVEAEDVDFTITGWKVVQLPISSKTTRSFTETVRTSQPSVSGDVDSCWSSASH